MTRPLDEKGRALPAAHLRLDAEDVTRMESAVVFAFSLDGRATFLPLMRKLTLARKAIDHVIDGDAVPKALFKRDPDFPDNHCMGDLWRTACDAVRTTRVA